MAKSLLPSPSTHLRLHLGKAGRLYFHKHVHYFPFLQAGYTFWRVTTGFITFNVLHLKHNQIKDVVPCFIHQYIYPPLFAFHQGLRVLICDLSITINASIQKNNPFKCVINHSQYRFPRELQMTINRKNK